MKLCSQRWAQKKTYTHTHTNTTTTAKYYNDCFHSCFVFEFIVLHCAFSRLCLSTLRAAFTTLAAIPRELGLRAYWMSFIRCTFWTFLRISCPFCSSTCKHVYATAVNCSKTHLECVSCGSVRVAVQRRWKSLSPLNRFISKLFVCICCVFSFFFLLFWRLFVCIVTHFLSLHYQWLIRCFYFPLMIMQICYLFNLYTRFLSFCTKRAWIYTYILMFIFVCMFVLS